MDIIAKIKLALKKKKEDVVLDLYIKDYGKCNYYMALVFNKKIDIFKILFVPIDLVDDVKKISEYFCYQFVYLNQVEHILEIMNSSENEFKNMNLDRKTNGFESYYVELNYYSKSVYTFKFSQYIDKDFLFLFDVIAVLFEYLPNIVSELCVKLLQDFSSNNISFKYNYTFDFNLFSDSLDKFDNDNLSYDDIKYIERIGSKYYVLLYEKIIVVDYIRGKNIVNISSSFDKYSKEHLLVINAIRDEIEKKFSRIIYDDLVFVCYGISNNKLKILGNDDIDMDFSNIKFRYLSDDLKKELDVYLENKYSKKDIKNIYNNLFEK